MLRERKHLSHTISQRKCWNTEVPVKGERTLIPGFYPANSCQMSNELIAALAQQEKEEEEENHPTWNLKLDREGLHRLQ